MLIASLTCAKPLLNVDLRTKYHRTCILNSALIHSAGVAPCTGHQAREREGGAATTTTVERIRSVGCTLRARWSRLEEQPSSRVSRLKLRKYKAFL